VSSLFARLLDLFRRRTLDRELEHEIATHLELAAEEMQARGMDPQAARQAALRQFGGVARAQEADREVRGFAALEHLWSAARYALRGWRRSPTAISVMLLTLAVGIGSTTAVFSVVYGVLLRPLPFAEPDRLVALYHFAPGFAPGGKWPQGAATYFTYRDHGQVFEDIGLFTTANVSVSRDGAPEEVQALSVSDGTLTLLGVRAERGRLIQKDDDVPWAPNRVVLTHGYWQRMFGAAEDVVGRSLVINATSYDVIGVLPASFTLLDTKPEVVVPLRLDRANTHTGGFAFNGLARLKPGVTLAQANDDIARMIPRLTEQFPLDPGVTARMWEEVGLAPNVRPLSEDVTGDLGRPLWILLGAVAIVLLIAWTNVANLLLVRAEARQTELAVRQALGASGGRIAFELLAESLTLGLAGGALGILFAQAGIVVLRWLAPAALPRVNAIGIDAIVLVVTLVMSVFTSLLFGLIPALKFRSLDITALKEAGRSTSDAPGRHRTRNALVVAQVALALVLLIVSGLMTRTFVAMRQVDPGYARPQEVQTFRIALPETLIRDRQQVAQTYQQIAEQLRQVPGVAAVGLANVLPMDGSLGGAPIFVEDWPSSGTPPMRRGKSIGPGYFEALGIPLIAGRHITWTDIRQLTPAFWISENLAREYWGEPLKALGKRIGGLPGEWSEIVGVTSDVRERGVTQAAPTMFYQPMAGRIGGEDIVSRSMSYVVRSPRVGAPGFVRELQHAVWSVNRNVPLARMQTLIEIQAASMSQTSFAMVMLAIAAGVALLLALVGVYGVVAHIVAERTHEIGIRMALGAQGRDIRRLFLRHGLALALTGIASGLGAAVLVTPVMSGLLHSVGAMDPVTYVGVALALGGMTLLATYLPARRASLVQPIIPLKSRI